MSGSFQHPFEDRGPAPPPLDALPGGPPTAHLAREWGLASLLLGGFLLLAGPVTLIPILFAGEHGLSSGDQRLVQIAGVLVFLMTVTLSGVGVGFGVRGVLAATVHRQPAALPLAGLLLSAAALFVWVLVGIAFFYTAF